MQRFQLAAILRRLALACLLAGSASAVAACGSSRPSQTMLTKPGPLSVGVSLSLTGDFADPGRAALRGYQLWADTVNNSGGILGRQVQLVVLNDGSIPKKMCARYVASGAEPVNPDFTVSADRPMVVTADLVEAGCAIRHDPDKLGPLLSALATSRGDSEVTRLSGASDPIPTLGRDEPVAAGASAING